MPARVAKAASERKPRVRPGEKYRRRHHDADAFALQFRRPLGLYDCLHGLFVASGLFVEGERPAGQGAQCPGQRHLVLARALPGRLRAQFQLGHGPFLLEQGAERGGAATTRDWNWVRACLADSTADARAEVSTARAARASPAGGSASLSRPSASLAARMASTWSFFTPLRRLLRLGVVHLGHPLAQLLPGTGEPGPVGGRAFYRPGPAEALAQLGRAT